MAKLDYFDSNVSVTGPYLNKKQQRRFVTIRNLVTKKQTQKTYAKYLMEVHLGRELSSDEEVDHIDRDKLNDVITNLQVLSSQEHKSKDSKFANKIIVPCAWCRNNIEKSPRVMRSNATQGSAGPFCSPTCRGKYGASVQNGGARLPAQIRVKSSYYYKK